MSDRLVIHRHGDSLVVTPRAEGFDLTVTGGGNVTASEFAIIEQYVTGKRGADAFLDKVRSRMDRTTTQARVEPVRAKAAEVEPEEHAADPATSPEVASKAGKLLHHEDPDVRSVAASALRQRASE